MPLKSSKKRTREEPITFPVEEQAVLTTIATLAQKSVATESTAELLSGLLDTTATACGSAGLTSSPSPSTRSLLAIYPEVRALQCAHAARCALRQLQACEPAARASHFVAVRAALEDIHRHVVPDELFAALAAVLAAWASDGPLPPPEVTRPLEVQMLKVVEALQLEVLRRTSNLTQRATVLTLRYRHQIPFCS